MRILTVANHLGSRGGLERTQLTTCRGLARRGHDVDLVYVSAGDFTAEWSGFCGTMMQVSGLLPRRCRPLASSAGLVRALVGGARLSPEVLYVYRYWDLPYAVALGRLRGTAVTFHLCLPPPTRIPVWLAAALRRVDSTLSVSRDTARRWEGTGLPTRSTVVVPTGIDLERFVPGDEDGRRHVRDELGIDGEGPLLLYAGRIGREKGIDVLLRAFSLVVASSPSARLVVLGSPSLGADPADSERYDDELRALAAGLPVTLLAGRGDIRDVLQAADVAVVPSLWPEPLSRSVMEPLACGVPVVASDAGGNPELLTGWLSEFLVPAGGVEALAERLVEVGDWRARRSDLGQRCRRHAEEHLSLDAETDLVERALHEAVDRPRRRSARRRSRSNAEAGSWG